MGMRFVIRVKRAAKLLFLFVALLAFTACSPQQDDHFVLVGQTMGTSYHITVVNDGSTHADQKILQQAIDQELILIS